MTKPRLSSTAASNVMSTARRRPLGAGESVYWPRGAVHKFRSLGPGDGRILFICSPGRIFEDFIARVASSPIDTGDAKSGPAVDFRGVAAQYGIEFVD